MRWKPAAWIARLMLILSVMLAGASFLAVGLRYPILLWLAAGVAAVRTARHGADLWSHGTARTAWRFDLLRHGLLGDQGLILGRVGFSEKPTLGQAARSLLDPRVPPDLACRMAFAVLCKSRRAAERMIRLKTFTHLLTVAPAGKGKSVSVLVPNLLSYRGSVVACDPKGELALLSCTHRRNMGHRCFVFDPFGILRQHGFGASDAFNPLDFIDASESDFLERCRDLANQLVIRTGEEKEPHFNDAAELILTAFIAFVVACEPNKKIRNLQTVRKLVSSRRAFARAVETMQKVEGFGGVIAIHGRLLTWFVDRELGSVMTTVQRHSAWMDSPAVAACLAHTTFDPRLLRTGRATAYLVLPHDKLVILAGLMRTWLGSFLRVATRSGADERNPVLFMVDEAGHLGHMRALQDAITLMRGYGIRIWLFFQSLGQLHDCYGKHAPIILGNTDTQQYFGLNDYETAEAISKKIGEETILVRTDNGGGSDSWPIGSVGREPAPGNRSRNWGWSVAELGRRLLKPEEILVLPEDVALIFHRNLPLIPAKLLKYYDAKEFRNGGTGVQRGPGLGTVLAAAVVLVTSLALAAGAVLPGLEPPRPVFAPAFPAAAGTEASQWQFDIPPPPLPPSGLGDAPAYRPTPRRRAYPPPRWGGDRGTFLPIR